MHTRKKVPTRFTDKYSQRTIPIPIPTKKPSIAYCTTRTTRQRHPRTIKQCKRPRQQNNGSLCFSIGVTTRPFISLPPPTVTTPAWPGRNTHNLVVYLGRIARQHTTCIESCHTFPSVACVPTKHTKHILRRRLYSERVGISRSLTTT